jgi:hypothetical protein
MAGASGETPRGRSRLGSMHTEPMTLIAQPFDVKPVFIGITEVMMTLQGCFFVASLATSWLDEFAAFPSLPNGMISGFLFRMRFEPISQVFRIHCAYFSRIFFAVFALTFGAAWKAPPSRVLCRLLFLDLPSSRLEQYTAF